MQLLASVRWSLADNPVIPCSSATLRGLATPGEVGTDTRPLERFPQSVESARRLRLRRVFALHSSLQRVLLFSLLLLPVSLVNLFSLFPQKAREDPGK